MSLTLSNMGNYNLSMRLFKRANGVYYAEMKRGIWRSLKTKDEREAKTRFKSIARDALKGKLLLLDKQSTITIQEFFDEYLKWAENNRSGTTHERATYTIKKFIEAVGGSKYLVALKQKDMDAFLDYCRMKGNKPSTLDIERRTIKGILTQAVKWEYVKENPFRGYGQIKFHKRLPLWLEVDEIKKVFDIIGNNRKYRLMFALFIYTGGRREEIKKLQWSDIKTEGIYFRETKNYQARIIPICESLENIIAEYDRGVGFLFDITLDQITHRIKYYLRKAGVGHIRTHDLRHTFASHLRKAGVTIDRIKELLGHKSLSTTMIYAHLDQTDLKEAMRKLPY